jgi:processive 1,2-diacylglycerol beta-glucosyltransferase
MPSLRSDLLDLKHSQPLHNTAGVSVDAQHEHSNGSVAPHRNGEACADARVRSPDAELADLPASPRILVVAASMGMGHLRASEAIELALRQRLPQAKVQTVDVFALATPPLRWAWSGMYLVLMRWAPQLLGWIYDFFDRPYPRTWLRLYNTLVLLQALNVRPFVRLLRSEPWDLVIHTFFFSGHIVARLKRRGRFAAQQAMVITDFESHRGWVTPPCEQYFTATQEAAEYLHVLGVPPRNVRVTGIPIHTQFGRPKERSACLERLGLQGDRPVVLLLSGGHGVAPIEEPYLALLRVSVPLDVLVVTGRNEAAKKRLEALPLPEQHRVRILGYTQQMDELLAAADLVVTKPGGLTVSEVLAAGTPLVLINPVPRQEERNSDFLLEMGAAIKVSHHATLALKITDLLRDPDRLERMKANALDLARPDAASEIVEHALALIRTPRQSACRRDG